MSEFWDGGIKYEKAEEFKQFINTYLDIHDKLYPMSDSTSNLHSMNHFVETFFNLDNFNAYSAFVFESINRETKNIIKSSINTVVTG